MSRQHILNAGLVIALILLSIIALQLLMRKQKYQDISFPSGTSNEYTLADVQENNSNASCWISYGSQVFDITRLVARLNASQADELLHSCGTNLDTLPQSIKTVDRLTEYQIGILTP